MRLIDADALEKAISISHSMTDDYGIKTGYEISMRLVEEQPTIEPERKKGKWLPDTNNYYEERFVCSVCGRSYKVDTCMGKPIWDFCPCGADMRGEQDDT